MTDDVGPGGSGPSPSDGDGRDDPFGPRGSGPSGSTREQEVPAANAAGPGARILPGVPATLPRDGRPGGRPTGLRDLWDDGVGVAGGDPAIADPQIADRGIADPVIADRVIADRGIADRGNPDRGNPDPDSRGRPTTERSVRGGPQPAMRSSPTPSRDRTGTDHHLGGEAPDRPGDAAPGGEAWGDLPWAPEEAPHRRTRRGRTARDEAPAVSARPPSDRALPARAAARALSSRRRLSSSGARWILEWLVVLTAAVAVALLVKAYVFQAFEIPSRSMVPTLQVHDRVVVNKLAYHFHDINRTDIVVFHKPPRFQPNNPNAPKQLVKRVIGLPGEKVESRDGQVFVNGEKLDESAYLPTGTRTEMAQPIVVPRGQILLLGDNRRESEDGRSFGPISTDLVIGRAFVRIWPLSRLDSL